MNTVILRGIPKDISFSHSIGPTDYYQCKFHVNNPNTGDEDVLVVKYKQFSNSINRLQEGKQIDIYGNIRSYTKKLSDGKSRVTIYVFTYLDQFDNVDNDYNYVELDGRLCKKDSLWKNDMTGKQSIHFTIANNIFVEGSKINSYISCVAFGKTAIELDKLDINAKIKVLGQLHSREYKKTLENGEVEIRVAHELIVTDFQVLEDNVI